VAWWSMPARRPDGGRPAGADERLGGGGDKESDGPPRNGRLPGEVSDASDVGPACSDRAEGDPFHLRLLGWTHSSDRNGPEQWTESLRRVAPANGLARVPCRRRHGPGVRASPVGGPDAAILVPHHGSVPGGPAERR